MVTELLSPAKDKETAIAAIDCGADAVYIGASAFGARKNAANSIEDIKYITDYAHKFWAKVFVTLNTILTDNELREALNLIDELEKIGVDAFIIQDLGLLNKLIKKKTRIPLHMSTQCDNYLPQKTEFFNKIGVSRVVLARELSLEQIKQIHISNPNLELEAFVHGALCVSMSGRCYLSQFIGGRSANRGDCAQPCRKKYTIETADGEVLKKDVHALCLKDFNASRLIDKMIDAGVFSFKIEGRLKDINYVKNITAFYRTKLGNGISAGKSFINFTPNPYKSFNRGFTEYFLNGRCDCFNFESPKSRGEYLGKIIEIGKDKIKFQSDDKNIVLHPQDGIYCNGEGFLVNKIESDTIYPNKMINFKLGDELYRNFDSEFDKELSKKVKRQIGVKVSVEKSSTPINNAESPLTITLSDENGVSLTKDFPSAQKANNPKKAEETFIKQFSKTGEGDFYIEDIKIAVEMPFLPISAINQLRRELFDKLIEKRINVYNSEIKQVQSELNYAQYFTDKVDYRANVRNSSAKEFYEKCGVEVIEPALETAKPNRQIELMRCKHCIKYALGICRSDKKLVLRDSYNNIYPLEFDCKHCEMKVLS